MRLTKNDSHDLGFVRWCLACEAISKNEFRQWVLYVIEEIDNPPSYIFDLIDFDGFLTDLNRLIPFTPDWSPTNQELAAISGITLSRGFSPYEPIDEEACIQAISQCASIRDWFTQIFPFIPQRI